MTYLARLIAAVLLIALFGAAQAQTDPSADPPGRVARLSDFNGQVWVFDTDSGEWVGAARNQPIATGDRLAIDAGARAELQLGSTRVRLDANTELAVPVLDDERVSLQLVSGSVGLRVADLAGAGQVEVETDEGRFVVQRAGSYRFDREGSTSRATVNSGQARYEGDNSALAVGAGQRAEFWIDSGGVAQYALSSPARDDFAAWNADQDRRAGGATALRYVSPEMTGAEDLDRYGRWEQSPDYGALWIPTAVAADWAPYRSGHWAWVAPWGWTWIDDAPWGFAPFHYGRWVYVRNNWCWTPGARVARPVYAPALVAWVGSPGSGVSVRVGVGPPVGWFPLAPREVYVPSYRVSPRYARDVNIAYGANAAQINLVFGNPQGRRDFDNRFRPNALTVVPSGVITGRQPVAPAAAQMRQNPQWREWRDNANQPGRAPILVAAPVTAPAVRPADPRASVRPPPGFAERPAGPRPGFGPGQQERDRDGRGRDLARPETPRPPPSIAQPQLPTAQPPAAPPAVTPGPPGRPVMRGDAPPQERRDDRRRPGEQRIEGAPPAPQVQQTPMMRAQPIRRAEERREPPPRPAEAAPQNEQRMRPQAPIQQREIAPGRPQPSIAPPQVQAPQPHPQMQTQPQMRIERPAPPAAMAPAPRVAPVAPVAPPRAVEAPRAPEPQRQAPEMRRGDPQVQQR